MLGYVLTAVLAFGAGTALRVFQDADFKPWQWPIAVVLWCLIWLPYSVLMFGYYAVLALVERSPWLRHRLMHLKDLAYYYVLRAQVLRQPSEEHIQQWLYWNNSHHVRAKMKAEQPFRRRLLARIIRKHRPPYCVKPISEHLPDEYEDWR